VIEFEIYNFSRVTWLSFTCTYLMEINKKNKKNEIPI